MLLFITAGVDGGRSLCRDARFLATNRKKGGVCQAQEVDQGEEDAVEVDMADAP